MDCDNIVRLQVLTCPGWKLFGTCWKSLHLVQHVSSAARTDHHPVDLVTTEEDKPAFV